MGGITIEHVPGFFCTNPGEVRSACECLLGTTVGEIKTSSWLPLLQQSTKKSGIGEIQKKRRVQPKVGFWPVLSFTKSGGKVSAVPKSK